MTLPTSFDTLRSWHGEQSRAFEELGYQLLKEDAPPGTRAIRTGNPDGGVEWYAAFSDGTEWGWQAKHVKGIDNLLTAMGDSVKRVASERPQLKKLIFVISWNLSTGTQGNERKSQRQKYEDRTDSWRKSVPGASELEFDLVQGSDLLDKLSKPEHRGRREFWWDESVFDSAWLERRYEEQASAAGDKYRPDLQVDLPIQDDLLALGLDSTVLGHLKRLARAIASCAADVRNPLISEDDSNIYRNIYGCSQELKKAAKTLEVQAKDPMWTLGPFLETIHTYRDAIRKLEHHERELERAQRGLSGEEENEQSSPPGQFNLYGLRSLTQATYDLTEWFEDGAGYCLRHRTYFLEGRAGSGKTHLLLDATKRALEDARPAVFLSGARFGRGDLWASIADQLGMAHQGADVLLGAMDAAGESAASEGRRFVLFVDALNETSPPDFWTVYLPVLRSKISQYPHIALVVSCRDTYRTLVLEAGELPHYRLRTHPGFAEREVEAAQRYFSHYGLQTPKFPLLTPEFTVPLFLRMYCESMAGRSDSMELSGHQGRLTIFERYLDAKVSKIARRYRRANSSYEVEASSRDVRRALDSLLDEFSRTSREGLSVEAAEATISKALAGTNGDHIRVLGLLQDEGVLTRERIYTGKGANEEGVRIVFQAFSDFLLLKRRIDLSSSPVEDADLRSWLTDGCSWGITEAATVLFPEVFQLELPDFLKINLSRPATREDAEKATYRQAVRLFRSVVDSLPYRKPEAITQRTIDILNATQKHMSRVEFYDLLFTIAPQPENRLNGDKFHAYLSSFQMPKRDADFGFASYSALSDSFGPAARLARWAATGPYPSYDTEIIELASIPLCWLFSSPNRYMRDWVTKALVQLLHGHLDVVQALVHRFWSVNDPYVVQRVMAVAYGSVLRCPPSQYSQAGDLAKTVQGLVFTPPVRADELLLDSARRIVRWALDRSLLPSTAAEALKRPYGIAPPSAAPLEATQRKKYGHHDQPPERSYGSILYSVFGFGDFGRYVIDSGARHFSRYAIGQSVPVRGARKPRLVKARWKAFVDSLTENQRSDLEQHLKSPTPDLLTPLARMRMRGEDSLNQEQRELLNAAWVLPNYETDTYPAEKAQRWVFRKTLNLGWTPDLFGREDRSRGHGRGREGHKAERWGKKYQWMAYHELLARLADNYPLSRRHEDDEEYEGLHQIIGKREIDPSLPPIDFVSFNEGKTRAKPTAWGPPPVAMRIWPPTPINFNPYRSDIHRFLADRGSEPTIESSIVVEDTSSEEWIVLEGWTTEVDPFADKSWRGIQQKNLINTLFVPHENAQALADQIAKEDKRDGVRELMDISGHCDCCFIGEVGRAAPNCGHRYQDLESVDVGGRTFQIVRAVESYTWEGNILDCSIEDSATALLPSAFLQYVETLHLNMQGPSWCNADGVPVVVHYEPEAEDGRALLVKASFLRNFLAQNRLGLVVMHWFERMELKEDHSRHELHPSIEQSNTGWLDATLTVREAKPSRRERDLRPNDN